MKIAARTEYACVALLELAAQYGAERPVRIRELAAKHGIPARFLVQILLQLKSAGLVSSTRGAAGGYRLARSPREISLAEVVRTMEGASKAAAAEAPPSPMVAALAEVWAEAERAQQAVLERTTLAELLQRAHARSQDMYYI